jgi:hypothetical protein
MKNKISFINFNQRNKRMNKVYQSYSLDSSEDELSSSPYE